MSRLDRRGVLKLLATAGAAGLVTACGGRNRSDSRSSSTQPLRIGLLVPSSGPLLTIGEQIRNGFRHYLAETGGLLGDHPVREVVADEGETRESAREAAEQLLQQEVHAIVGVANPAVLAELTPLVEEAHVPLLSANGSAPDLRGGPYLWRTAFLNSEPGLALGRYLASEVDGPVAIIAQDDQFGIDAVAGLREAFATAQASNRLAEPIFTRHRDVLAEDGLAGTLNLLADQRPAAVFAAYSGEAASAFLTQYLHAGLSPRRLYGPADLTEGPVLEALGKDTLGIRTASNYAPELRGSTNQLFALSYRDEFGPPTTYAVAAYDAAAVLDTAIRLVDGDITPRLLTLALGEVGLIDSPRGRWQFNQSRTPTQRWYLRQVAWDGPVIANLVVGELGTLG